MPCILPLHTSSVHAPSQEMKPTSTQFQHSNSSCFAQVVNAWLKCFHVLVPLLDKALIKGKILPVALAKGANDETSVQSRVICCAMLGSMAACLTKVIVVIILNDFACLTNTVAITVFYYSARLSKVIKVISILHYLACSTNMAVISTLY